MDTFGNFPSSPPQNRNTIRVFSAVIDRVTRERNTTYVTISYNDCIGCNGLRGPIQLVVNQNTAIRDERGRNVRAGELERGMIVDATFSSAVTRSIPPQSQAFSVRIIRRPNRTQTTIGRMIEVNTRSNYILVLRSQNPSSVVRFNISPNTEIFNLFGRRTSLSSLTAGFRVKVEHASFMTASIPPQTSAFSVRVIR